MIKRFALLCAVSGLLLLGIGGSSVSAHELKTDGTIGAVLHIDPDDNPTTGSPTSYVLYFSDTTGKFSLPKCNCQIGIQENGNTVYAHPLAATDALDSYDTYTFTKPAVYTLQVSGQPKQAGMFQSFRLQYLVRVTAAQGSAGMQPFPPLLWVGLGLLIGLVLLGAYKTEHSVQ